MINLLFPALNVVDGWLSALPLLIRIGLWGALAGTLSMLTYAKLSNQTAITAMKKETRALRTRLMDPKVDSAQLPELLQRNLKLSLLLLGRVLLPTLASTVPVLLLAVWLDTFQGFAPPQGATDISLSGLPGMIEIGIQPESQVRMVNGLPHLIVPQSGSSEFHIRADEHLIYVGDPFSPPTPIITKKRWGHLLLASESGYLSDDAPMDTLNLGFEPRRLVSSTPAWMGGWEFCFFVFVAAAALSLKFGLRLE